MEQDRRIVDSFTSVPLFAGGSTVKALDLRGIKIAPTQEYVGTNQNLSAESLPENLSLRIMEMQLQTSPELCLAAVDNLNAEGETAGTSETDYGISREDIMKHAGKKLQDVAKIFGVSPSTLKRICRKHLILRWPVRGVTRWPVSKANKLWRSVNSQEVGIGMQLTLGTWNGYRSYSVVQSNSPSSLQEMSLGNHLRLGCENDVRDYIGEESCNSSLSTEEMSRDIHLRFGPSLELEDDSTSSCSNEMKNILE